MLKKEFQLNLCLINMSSNIKSVYRILEKDRLVLKNQIGKILKTIIILDTTIYQILINFCLIW